MKTFRQWLAMPRNTHNIKREKLDFNKLNNKAVKITYKDGIEAEDGFSIVTPLNRNSWNWKINPQAEKLVMDKDILNGSFNGKPNLDDAKYMQIITAAKSLGLM